jgi:hypothetical protein
MIFDKLAIFSFTGSSTIPKGPQTRRIITIHKDHKGHEDGKNLRQRAEERDW